MDNYEHGKFITIDNAKIYYIEEGAGDPMLFLHGIPASSYIWRKIIPHLAQYGRCIAPDLIGMGQSSKLEIQYTILDHINYIDKFIKALDLRNITLVLHGLGSIIGFHYASEHPQNIKGIAFYESHTHVLGSPQLAPPMQYLEHMMQKSKNACYKAIIEKNYLLKKLLPSTLLRTLKPTELAHYTEPFSQVKHRQPLWQYLVDLISPNAINQVIQNYTKYLQTDLAPKLMFYNIPGLLSSIELVKRCKNDFANLKLIDLGDGHHLAQETNPSLFAKAIRDWYLGLQC